MLGSHRPSFRVHAGVKLLNENADRGSGWLIPISVWIFIDRQLERGYKSIDLQDLAVDGGGQLAPPGVPCRGTA